jgi:hypothetical protein
MEKIQENSEQQFEPQAHIHFWMHNEDLILDSGYGRLISDMKKELVQYAEFSNKREILDRANLLATDGRDLKSDLNMLLLLLKTNKT